MKKSSDLSFATSIILMLLLIGFQNQSTLATGVCTIANLNAGTLVPVGTNPRSIVSGDLDGDGDNDNVVANTGGFSGSVGTVSILLNDGAGNFSQGTTLSPNFSVQAVTLADFNFDGVLDIAVAGGNNSSTTTQSLAVYYGLGNGLFSSPLFLNSTNFFVSVTSGDLNRDGLPDIIATGTGNTVFNFINNGGNDFLSPTVTSVGTNPRFIATGDFNGDGNLDAVTANQSSNNISLLFGQGDGTFRVAVNLPVVPNNSSFAPVAVAAGDLNGDNRLDLVVGGTDSANLAIFINNGAGGFADPISFNTQLGSSDIQAVLIGEFSGGGSPDVAVVASAVFSDDPNRVVILRGVGNGTLDPNYIVSLPTGLLPLAAVAADFNQDGRLDIATANSTSNNVAILSNNNFGGFGARQNFLTNQPLSLVSADFNGDGNLDIVTGASNPSSSSSPAVTLQFGDGTGNFINSQTITSSSNASIQFVARDINNDNRPDLISFGANVNGSLSNTVQVYRNTGMSPSFSTPADSYVFSGTIQSVAIGDFNRDGRPDILAGLTSNGSVALLLGGTNGVFASSSTNFAVPIQPSFVTVGDFNNDGNLDAAAFGTLSSSSTSNVVILLGNGAGAFTQTFTSPAITSSSAGIVSADFNGDGRLDVAVLSNNSNFGGNGVVSVLSGLGDGRLAQPTTYTVGLNPRSLRVGDFNGDNRPDIVVANRGSNTVSLLINGGSGNFTQNLNLLAGILPNAIEIGDFNRDGKNDVIVANFAGLTLPGSFASSIGTLGVLTNNCKEAITKTDYDADGRTDFAVFRPSNGTWYNLNSGNGQFQAVPFGQNGDIPAKGDFDGDGKTDISLFRPSNGTWFIIRSSNNRLRTQQFGQSGDVPVQGDYDGDGRADIAVFRPSNGVWYVLRSSSPNSVTTQQFGQNGDKPVPADYDGDGRTDFAVFRNGNWYVLQSSNAAFRAQQFGVSTDVPVQGDYDADGKSDFAVYRSGVWFAMLSSTNAMQTENFGLDTDKPQPGDYNGDGKTDFTVFRPSNGTWYVRPNGGNSYSTVAFGANGDIPVATPYQIQ